MRQNLHPLVKAILYADIFKYALTKEELFKYSIGKCTTSDLIKFINNLPEFIIHTKGLFCLKHHAEYINLRHKRKAINKLKLERAKKIIRILKIIPSIKFIGISGAVAMENADSEDDIDLFIIAEDKSIWKTRLFTTVLLSILGAKRSRGSEQVADKICINMFMTTQKLNFDDHRHEIFTAHEITQIISLLDRDKTYEKFLSANTWVANFLPNAFNLTSKSSTSRNKLKADILEKIAKYIQIWYMKKRITTETVDDSLLAFHPLDYRNSTINKYMEDLKKYA